MARLEVCTIIVFLLTSCQAQDTAAPLPDVLPTNSSIFASDSRDVSLRIEGAQAPDTINIAWSRESKDCMFSATISENLQRITAEVSNQSLEILDEIAFTPGQRVLNAQVALVQMEEHFEIRYVVEEESMFKAANGIQSILDECGVAITFRTVRIIKPSH